MESCCVPFNTVVKNLVPAGVSTPVAKSRDTELARTVDTLGMYSPRTGCTHHGRSVDTTVGLGHHGRAVGTTGGLWTQRKGCGHHGRSVDITVGLSVDTMDGLWTPRTYSVYTRDTHGEDTKLIPMSSFRLSS